ncbi:hypothetical protein D3C87_324940 [compost metagenome]
MIDYPALIEKLADNFSNTLDAVIEQARQAHVIPYCDANNLEFSAGMGTWNFRSIDGKYSGEFVYASEYGDIPDNVLEVLQMEYPLNRGQSCGSMMESYKPVN